MAAMMTTRISTAAACALLLAASQAHADCGDRPAQGVDWSGCTKERLVLRGQKLAGAKLDRAVLLGVDFGGADLGGAMFRQAEINHASFRRALLRGASFEKAVVVRADFSGAQFGGAKLEKAEFHRSDLSGAMLKDVDLSKGDFGRSNFDGADLRGATLRLSNVARASFVRARLDGADFRQVFTFGARFAGTDLSTVKSLTQEQLDVACGDAATKLPPGMKRPGSWPCAEE
jgi:uncharacterized protein YjbI with pentapeptide repeats